MVQVRIQIFHLGKIYDQLKNVKVHGHNAVTIIINISIICIVVATILPERESHY